MKTKAAFTLLGLALIPLLVVACSGGGGGTSKPSSKSNQAEVETFMTVGADGSWGQVDLVDGGVPVLDPNDPNDPGIRAPNPGKQTFLSRLMTTQGVDLDRNLVDTDGDGIGDAGFDSYETGMAPGKSAGRILGANNVYDLFQTTTGTPILFNPTVVPAVPGGPPFNGGDATGDNVPDGGPGLFSNLAKIPGGSSLVPRLPVLPNSMGTTVGGSGLGPSATDQHQFIQIVFPYNLDRDSLFNPLDASNSFLGDSAPGASANVFVEKRWVTRSIPDDDDVNVVDHTFERKHVSGIAIIGGEAAIPFVQGGPRTLVDKDLSNLPEGCKALVGLPNVLTYIAHENPGAITQTSPSTIGNIDSSTNLLVLPDPKDPAGLGGRVFGADLTRPSAVNDFSVNPYDPGNAGALAAEANRRVGFFFFDISRLRTNNGVTLDRPYFHSFPMSQAQVGADLMAVDGSFNRGPAVAVDTITKLPTIDVLDPTKDYLPPVLFPTSDTVNTISARARFVVAFDKEVVPNSVGFSRRYTIHTVQNKGIVFPYSGNTRPIVSPATSFTGTLGAPLGPSIYLAVNQSTQVAVNNPFVKDFNGNSLKDDGTPIQPGVTAGSAAANAMNGLFPTVHNTLATLPRGVVPCDIYPVNQNNLQRYVVEPLVELPPGSVVTLGVCMQGLGVSNNNLPAGFPAKPTNLGNYTRSGTMFTPWQGLTPVGLGDSDVSTKQNIIANHTIVKVNAGPMDLEGNLFFGGTDIALDILIDGNPGNNNNDSTYGTVNVSRTFRVGQDASRPYLNAPVAPMALYAGFGNKGIGVMDLSGTGVTTNAPGGALQNTGFETYFLTSRFLSTIISGNLTLTNWVSNGSVAGGNHQSAFGLMGRYTAGGCSFCALGAVSFESELAVGAAIGIGPASAVPGGGTPVPGVNEGSSGYETMVRNSAGSQLLTSNKIGLVRDIMVGQFLDAVYFDVQNPFAVTASHRTYNAPAEGAVQNNTIADPPFPNPPPLRFPVGLPHTAVIFDQDDLSQKPFVIEGSEAFAADTFMRYNDGTGLAPFTYLVNSFIQLNPTINASNANSFDVPPLPNFGFPNPFIGAGFATLSKFVQTGPVPRSSTAGAVVLATLNATGGPFDPGGLEPPLYQSRQQIGNFLFVTDGVNKKLHALNSNNMEIIESLNLPDPYGMGLSPDLEKLYVSNEGDNSVSIVDADPRNASFMTELKRIKVGDGPRAVAVSPDDEDVLVLNRLGNTISIIDVGTNSVRHTLTQSGINRPNDVAVGMREVTGGPAFQSHTYHAFISNGGGDNILVYESGPSGVAGIGFDNILGDVKPNDPPTIGSPIFLDMDEPRGLAYDPNAPLDTFAHTVGCFVAHNDPTSGRAVVSRVAYTKDDNPGVTIFDATFLNPGFGEKVFEVVQQYVSDFTGIAYHVGLPDYKRETFVASDFKTNSNLLNAGASILNFVGGSTVASLPRNAKYPVATNLSPPIFSGPRWDPDRLYLAIGGGIIDVFDVRDGTHLKTVSTSATPTVLAAYFSQ